MLARMMLPLAFLVVAALVLLVITRTARPRVEPEDRAGPRPDTGASVERARERLRQAEARYAARVSAAEERLAQARRDVEVLRAGGVVLGRCTVLVGGREHDLTEETRFAFAHEGTVAYRVDEEGEASRIVEDDRRHGRLIIEGEGWADGVDVIPADFVEAERLVAAGQAAARTVAAARQERAEGVERAWAELEEARASSTEVDEARLTLEDVLGAGPRTWDVPEPPEEE